MAGFTTRLGGDTKRRMPHENPRYEAREKGAVMCYWFPRWSFVLLVGAVAFAALGLITELDPHPYPLRWGVLTAEGLLLASAAAVSRRRFAVMRFKWIYGFLPPTRPGENKNLVAGELRNRAQALLAAYKAKDIAQGLEVWTLYRSVAELHKRKFYRAIDAARSGALPAPYPNIGPDLADWAPKPKIAQTNHPS